MPTGLFPGRRVRLPLASPQSSIFLLAPLAISILCASHISVKARSCVNAADREKTALDGPNDKDRVSGMLHYPFGDASQDPVFNP